MPVDTQNVLEDRPGTFSGDRLVLEYYNQDKMGTFTR
jgi:hypothetical protein